MAGDRARLQHADQGLYRRHHHAARECGWRGGTTGLGVHVRGQLINFGAFVSAVVYFAVYVAVIYFVIVVPYRLYRARRGVSVFGEPAPTKVCPECLSDDLPAPARKCKHCGSSLSVATT